VSKTIYIVLSLLFAVQAVSATNNVETQSIHNVEETAKRYVSALKEYGVPYVEVTNEGKSQHIAFTNPFFGTIVGRCGKGIRKDEPWQATIWKDSQGAVWLSYPVPTATTNDFGVIECGHESDKMRKVLSSFADLATSP